MESRDILDTEQTKCTESYNHTTYSQHHAGAVLGSLCATNEKSIVNICVFYGRPPSKDEIVRTSCLVYGFYGEND